MQTRVLYGLLRLRIEPGGVRIALAANIRRDGAFKFRLAQLLEHRGAEHRVVERRGSQSDQSVFVRAFEAVLVSARNPQCEKPQNAARLLKTRERLPFPLED